MILTKLIFFEDIEASWVLDTKNHRTPRMFFIDDEGKNVKNSTMRLQRGKIDCRVQTVYISVSGKISHIGILIGR